MPGVASVSAAWTPTPAGGAPAAITVTVGGVPKGSVPGLPKATITATVTSLGAAGVSLLQNSASNDFTLANAWTPTSRDVAVRITWRANEINVMPLLVTLAGVTLTVQASGSSAQNHTAGAWIGTGRDIPLGSPVDLRVQTNSSNTMNKVELRIDPLVNWTGVVGGVAGDTVHGTDTNSITIAATMTRSTRLVLGAAVALDANCDPLSVAGWNVDDRKTSGSTALLSTAAVFVSGTGDGAGTTKQLVATSGTSCSQWAAAMVEL